MDAKPIRRRSISRMRMGTLLLLVRKGKENDAEVVSLFSCEQGYAIEVKLLRNKEVVDLRRGDKLYHPIEMDIERQVISGWNTVNGIVVLLWGNGPSTVHTGPVHARDFAR